MFVVRIHRLKLSSGSAPRWSFSDELTSTWHDLHARMRSTLPGQCEAEFRALTSGYDSQAIRILEVKMLGRTVGLLPLLRAPVELPWSTRDCLRSIDGPTGTLTRPIGPNTAATWAGFMKYLRHNPQDWLSLELNGIDESIDNGRARNAIKLAKLPCETQTTPGHFAFELTDHAKEELGLEQHPHACSSIQHGHRQFLREGDIKLLRYRSDGFDESLERFIDLLESMPTAGDAKSIQSCVAYLRHLDQNGKADINVLCVGTSVRAILCGAIHQRIGSYAYCFLDNLSPHASLALLIGMMIRNGNQYGDQTYELPAWNLLQELAPRAERKPVSNYLARPNWSVSAMLRRTVGKSRQLIGIDSAHSNEANQAPQTCFFSSYSLPTDPVRWETTPSERQAHPHLRLVTANEQ